MKKDVCDWLSRAELREAKFICLVRVTNNWDREHPADKWFWSLPLEET